jgi:Tfp pilus assembly protein PilF
MRYIAFTLSFCLLAATWTRAQSGTSVETVRTEGGTNMQVKGRASGMYEGSASEQAMAYYRQGVREHQRGELASAIRSYNKALKEDPKFVEAYDNLGQVYRQAGQYDDAIKCYNKSLKLYPEGEMARMNLAVVHSIKGDLAGAKKDYQALVKYHPEGAEGYFGLANVQMLLKQYDEALVNAEKALAIYQRTDDPHLPDGYHMVGLIHYYAGRTDEARTYLQRARERGAKIHPDVAKDVFSTPARTTGTTTVTGEQADEATQAVEWFDWLYNTPVGAEPEKRKKVNADLILWITNTSLVTVEVKEKIVPYMDQGECLVIYLGAYAKYVLRNSNNVVEANQYATTHVLDFYEKNRDALGPNKGAEKLLRMRKEGKLEDYIKANS